MIVIFIYQYPQWATTLGWFVASLSLTCVPLGIIDELILAGRKTFQNNNLFKSEYRVNTFFHNVRHALKSDLFLFSENPLESPSLFYKVNSRLDQKLNSDSV